MGSVDFPKTISNEFDILVKKGYYSSTSDLLTDAFRTLLHTKGELKISLAIELYLEGKISIGRASELAGLTTIEFKEVMGDRGIIRETEGRPTIEIDAKLKKLGIV